MVAKNLKGVSPVIATILMVMITVGLVAFSYTWFTQMGQKAQQQAGGQISQMEKSQQSFDIPTVFECNINTSNGQITSNTGPNVTSGSVCFEFRASSMNTLNIPVNDSISLYIDNIPKSLGKWNYSNNPCITTQKLSPGKSCYAYTNITDGTTDCPPGAVHTLKISHTWGAPKEVSVRCS